MRVLRLLLPIAIVALSMALPVRSSAQVYISLFAPPMMPAYTQPAVSTPNAIWTPGYWAWGSAGYYWVPGTYVTAPSQGLYWTPGYWGMNTGGAGYMWNQGYWGPGVGFYGGVNYGGGYYGNGYAGGTWQGPAFAYNTAVTPVNTTVIRNVYVNKTVIVRNVNRYSYNGPGGIRMQPNAQQLAFAREKRAGLTPAQRAHITEASQDRNLYAKVNNGKPPEAAVARPLSTTNRPADFKPLTAADKAPANAPMAKPNAMSKPAGNPSTMHAAPKPEANPAEKPAPKPAAKPAPKPVAKPAPEKMKPAAPQGKPAGKPPAAAKPETKATHPPSR